ncbi:MAG: hypothetical protein K0Q49_1139 [Haloplasmataceae bacterium]|jgi:hypothetical protein|nr:hypothetical protein [Haloplasmataceae bacterium]
MIDYMKSGFDLLDEDQREKNVNKKDNFNSLKKLNQKNNDVETAEEFYEFKTQNTTDYSTETFEGLEFAEDDIDLVKPFNSNKKYKINKNKK